MKTKILFLLHIPPPIHGSSMVGLSIKESDKINEYFDCSYFDLMASNNINESGKITLKKIFGFISVWLKLLQYLLRHRPALCYMALTTTGAAFKRDVLIVALLKLFNIKRVYHLHNKGINRFNKNKIFSVLYKFTFKNAHTILLSQRLFEDISKYADKTKVAICPNGISKDIPSLKKENTNVPQILFLSNLIESKGVRKLIDACQILSSKHIPYSCSFVGGEGDISALEFKQYVERLNLQDQIRYLGKKTGLEKYQIYKNSDIFAFPTYYPNECFPLVILEAMQAHLPVISTYEGGIPDIIEDGVTGFLVPQLNTEALADKLEILLADATLRSQMGDIGYKQYLEKFTFETFEQRLLDILSHLSTKL